MNRRIFIKSLGAALVAPYIKPVEIFFPSSELTGQVFNSSFSKIAETTLKHYRELLLSTLQNQNYFLKCLTGERRINRFAEAAGLYVTTRSGGEPIIEPILYGEQYAKN